MSHSAIILGSAHHNTYGVCRSLGVNGVKPIVYIIAQNDSCFFRKSRYISDIKFFESQTSLLNYLCSNESPDGVIFACTDKMAFFVDANKDSLATKYILPGVKKGKSILDMMDKTWLAKAALDAGLSIPPTSVVSTKKSNEWNIYPCIVKPLNSITGEKNDIGICSNSAELAQVLNHSPHKELIIQKYIEKDFEYQLIGVSFCEGKKVYIPGVTRLIRATDPRTNTGTVLVEPVSDYNIALEKVKGLIELTGYSGLFSAEFLRDKEGNDYFLEVNFRNDGNSIAMTAANANIHMAWYNQRFDESTRINKHYTMPLFPMIKRVIRRKIKLKEFFNDLRHNPTFMDFSWKDPYILITRLRSLMLR